MAHFEFEKNRSEIVVITPERYQGYDLIDIRIRIKTKNGEWVLTRKGITLNIDQIPELINGLEWALQQPCEESPESESSPLLTKQEEDELASCAYEILKKHGIDVHWDTAELMVLKKPGMNKYNKWHLHYVLATRRELFKPTGSGCFKAI